MATKGSVAENAAKILELLYTAKAAKEFEGPAIAAATGLEADAINDAVTILVENGYAEWMRFLGTSPYSFGIVHITPRGRFAYEKDKEMASSPNSARTPISSPPLPVGSPYGFQDEDWEVVATRKANSEELNVVLGFQFKSTHYKSDVLASNVEEMFESAVNSYRASKTALPVKLSFRVLSAGYGGHLFNEIARDIISSDICVFETSDLNPNVMLELGVALTWGIRVLAIKAVGCPQPPSDVSGHTWADYEDNGLLFRDVRHSEKLLRMVERAIRKKSHA